MPVLKNGRFSNDPWVLIADGEPLPDSGHVVVSFTRLEQEWDRLAAHTCELGVEVPNTLGKEALLPYLGNLSLIILPFPAFTDGRAYSLARLLREEGYVHELRAKGNVLPDQLQFMKQVGFTSFEVSDRFPEAVWQKAASLISAVYQPGYTDPEAARTAIWKARQAAK